MVKEPIQSLLKSERARPVRTHRKQPGFDGFLHSDERSGQPLFSRSLIERISPPHPGSCFRTKTERSKVDPPVL